MKLSDGFFMQIFFLGCCYYSNEIGEALGVNKKKAQGKGIEEKHFSVFYHNQQS